MAKRDPYRIPVPLIYCSCQPRSNCPTHRDASQQIRRARHAGKREAHAAVIEAPTEPEERHWADLCYVEFFPEDPSDAWWPLTWEDDQQPVPTRLATIADAFKAAPSIASRE